MKKFLRLLLISAVFMNIAKAQTAATNSALQFEKTVLNWGSFKPDVSPKGQAGEIQSSAIRTFRVKNASSTVIKIFSVNFASPDKTEIAKLSEPSLLVKPGETITMNINILIYAKYTPGKKSYNLEVLYGSDYDLVRGSQSIKVEYDLK